MVKVIVLFSILFCFSSVCVSQDKDENVVRSLLQSQAQQWNAGNVKQFMSTYWNNDSLMFIGKNGITYGWQKTMDNYIKGYPDTTSMGKLNFDLLSVKKISVEYFFVVGKWHLRRTIGDLAGSFTLLVKKIKGRWLIVADHSS